eukprot:984276_1
MRLASCEIQDHECLDCGGRTGSFERVAKRHNLSKYGQLKSKILLRMKDADKTGLSRFVASVDWINCVLVFLPIIWGWYSVLTYPLCRQTIVLSVIFYLMSGFGITAGYHRLFSHRAYSAHWLLRLFYACFGAAAVQGSIKWWCIGHRAHHRYTDTDRDPYNSERGFFYAHMGWLLLKQDYRRIGRVDIEDLKRDPIVRIQHTFYLPFVIFFSLILPSLIAHYGWNDGWGGFVFAGWFRIMCIQQSTFCVNSVAHYFGTKSFDDTLTPRDSIITAVLTLGEGYHNFHHEFPYDYRNAIRWYQYDPTKWFIRTMSLIGMAFNLRKGPENEIQKGQLNIKLATLKKQRERVSYGTPVSQLPKWTMSDVKRRVGEGELLVIINDVIHDVTTYEDTHPGGPTWFRSFAGKDATQAFDGGVNNHTTAARNLLSQFRVARVEDVSPKK